MLLIRILRAPWRVLRVLVHVLHGWWLVWRHAGSLSEAEMAQTVQRWSATLLRCMGITVQVEGTPPAAGPMLLVSNHISWLDIPVVHAARPCRFVAKAGIRHWPLVGTMANGAGTLYIERESRRDALRVVHQMADALRNGDIVAVFPEGTTGDGRTMLPFHANLLQAALVTNQPAQPMALRFIDTATGQTSFAPSFVGDETLLGSVWRTLAAPPMSNFISSMPSPGFSEMPPESKVMPLPTSTSGLSSAEPPPYWRTIIFGGWREPLATESSECMPSFSMSAVSRISQPSLNSAAIACACSAR